MSVDHVKVIEANDQLRDVIMDNVSDIDGLIDDYDRWANARTAGANWALDLMRLNAQWSLTPPVSLIERYAASGPQGSSRGKSPSEWDDTILTF
jgi:hypothetical protein